MKYLFLIIFISISFQIAFLMLDKAPDTDEVWYMTIGENILKTNFPSINGVDPYLIHPPLFTHLIALFFKLFGKSFLIARLISMISSLIVLIFTYFTVKELKNKIANLSIFLLGINPFFLYFSSTVYIEMFLMALLSASIYYLFKGFKTNKSKYFLISGIIVGLGTITKYNAFILVFAFIIYNLIQFRWKIFFQKKIYIFLIPIIFIFSLWIIYGLMLDKKLFLDQQLFVLSYFNSKSWHLATWRVVSNFTLLKQLVAVITPVISIFFIISLILTIFEIVRKKLKTTHSIFFLFIFLCLFIIGVLKTQFKDIHYPLPILGFIIVFSCYYLNDYFSFFLKKKTISFVGSIFFLWLSSPFSIFYNPLDNKFYDNIYIWGIKRDINYRIYQEIGKYLNDITSDNQIIVVETKSTITKWYINKKVIVSDMYFFDFENKKEFVLKADIVVLEEGISAFLNDSEEENFIKFIQEKFVLKKTFEFPFEKFSINTDQKILKQGDKKKTVWVYVKK
ncbi:MAG: glycosyltransferase family 39 protein [bacterium]